MDNIELVLTNLGEVAAVEIHKRNNIGAQVVKKDINIAGNILSKAKRKLEN